MKRKYNVLKVMLDTGNHSWAYPTESLEKLIEYCNNAKNVRKTCSLHFYTFKIDSNEKLVDDSNEYINTIMKFRPKHDRILNDGNYLWIEDK